MSQIGFFTTEQDERGLVEYVHDTGGKFVPFANPTHPLPQLAIPLPPATEAVVNIVCVRFDDVMSEAEFDSRTLASFNPAAGLYCAGHLPVLGFRRCRMNTTTGLLLTGALQFQASISSFGEGFPHTPEQTADFSARLRLLENHYR